MNSNYSGKLIANRYKLVRQVATGGMGEVWTARDVVSNRHIAVKVLKPELAGQETFLQRLRMEARNAMQMEHPNVAAVLDHGEEDGVGWIVMEYVEGRPFNEYLRDRNRIAPDQLIPVLIQTAYALQAAHAREVVHRDIKPSNLIITPEGVVKLTDFGISTTPHQTTMTEAGMVMGTAQYLPPEQAMGEPATHAGDLYALGVIAYEALAGRRPFTGKSQVDVAFAHVNEPVPALPSDVPPVLGDIVMALLNKKPADRPKDGSALARQLANAARDLDLDTAPKPVSLPDVTVSDAPSHTAALSVTSETKPRTEARHVTNADTRSAKPTETPGNTNPPKLNKSDTPGHDAHGAPSPASVSSAAPAPSPTTAPSPVSTPSPASDRSESAASSSISTGDEATRVGASKRPARTQATYRHTNADPHAFPLLEVAVVAVVLFVISFLTLAASASLTSIPVPFISTPVAHTALDDISVASCRAETSTEANTGNLADSTFTEVPKWLTTSPTA